MALKRLVLSALLVGSITAPLRADETAQQPERLPMRILHSKKTKVAFHLAQIFSGFYLRPYAKYKTLKNSSYTTGYSDLDHAYTSNTPSDQNMIYNFVSWSQILYGLRGLNNELHLTSYIDSAKKKILQKLVSTLSDQERADLAQEITAQ